MAFPSGFNSILYQELSEPLNAKALGLVLPVLSHSLIVTVVSKKHLDVYTQTMYIRRKKEKSLATTPGDENIRPHTSETLSGTASNDSIAKI